jgi:hypothetical protein
MLEWWRYYNNDLFKSSIMLLIVWLLSVKLQIPQLGFVAYLMITLPIIIPWWIHAKSIAIWRVYTLLSLLWEPHKNTAFLHKK